MSNLSRQFKQINAVTGAYRSDGDQGAYNGSSGYNEGSNGYPRDRGENVYQTDLDTLGHQSIMTPMSHLTVDFTSF